MYFVGLDVIGEKLIEVNFLRACGIAILVLSFYELIRINKLNRIELQEKVVDFVERVVAAKEIFISRKHSFRKSIEDAKLI